MSLTTVSKKVRRGVNLSIVFVIVYMLTKAFLLPATKSLLLTIFPPKNPPNPVFGKLSPIEFEQQKITNTGGSLPEFTLNTTSGRLPSDLPNRMTVYRYTVPAVSFDAGRRATAHARTLGFEEETLTTSLKGNLYQWNNPATGSNLSIEINNKNLEMTTPHNALLNKYQPGSINQMKALETAEEILIAIGRYSDPLYRAGEETVALGKIGNSKIEAASYSGEAQIALVDYFRSIKDYPIVGPKHKEGLIRVTVTGSKNEILRHPIINYRVREIDQQSNATYPLISVSSAWNAVKENRGVISYVRSNYQSAFDTYRPIQINEILINEVYLAYYDDGDTQQYLQPIYVFEGNYIGTGDEKGEISIYFPAISGEYIKAAEPE